MINFFRKIRKQLADDNKPLKYMRYAIGEVTLIMIGIFMAFQLQNWSEKRKQEAQFKNTLEQLYATINYDSETFLRHSGGFKYDVESLELLLEKADAIPDAELPLRLYFLTYGDEKFFSKSTLYINDLIAHPENKIQRELTKEILNYIHTISNLSYEKDQRLLEAIKHIDIAPPLLNTNLIQEDSTYYESIDFDTCRELLKTRKFKSILKTVRTLKKYNHSRALNYHKDALSIMKLMKDYYPAIKILYKDVGIIGTAINGYDDVGASSTPMKLTDADNSIWEIQMPLKKGTVKFRCRDSWFQNWGLVEDEEFPKGNVHRDGRDIPIPTAGNYKIILNLSENTYQFIIQDDQLLP